MRFFNTTTNLRASGITRVRRGLSLVEVMISLAISAMLLTAVAAAFTASSDAIEVNDEFFRASQAARVSMNQILTEIRRANAIQESSGSTLQMITHDNKDRTYSYDATRRQLKLITNDVTTDPDYTLTSNCPNASFEFDTYTDTAGIKHVIRVSVTIVVQVGSNQIRLSGSAAPRKEQVWQ